MFRLQVMSDHQNSAGPATSPMVDSFFVAQRIETHVFLIAEVEIITIKCRFTIQKAEANCEKKKSERSDFV